MKDPSANEICEAHVGASAPGPYASTAAQHSEVPSSGRAPTRAMRNVRPTKPARPIAASRPGAPPGTLFRRLCGGDAGSALSAVGCMHTGKNVELSN